LKLLDFPPGDRESETDCDNRRWWGTFIWWDWRRAAHSVRRCRTGLLSCSYPLGILNVWNVGQPKLALQTFTQWRIKNKILPLTLWGGGGSGILHEQFHYVNLLSTRLIPDLNLTLLFYIHIPPPTHISC